MEFSAHPNLASRKRAELLVLPFWQEAKHAVAAADLSGLKADYEAPIQSHDFKGKEGDIAIVYAKGQPESRIVLLGLGEKKKISVELLRRSFANVVKFCRKHKLKELNLLVPEVPSLSEEEVIRGVSEGLLLTNYSFLKLKGEKVREEPSTLLTKATLIGANKKTLAVAEMYAEIAEGVYFARDLVNDNADTVTPSYLVKVAQGLSKTLSKVKTTILDKAKLEKEGMGLILAVSRASLHEPALIIVEYKGNPKSKEHTVIVGKGVTYDTGGLDLKTVGGFGHMDTMKADMGGAAAVLGTIFAAAKLELAENITAVIPAVENAIGPGSYKPGDVYVSYHGKTIEITSTDAEGRLILADALAYAAQHLKPTRIIDFATLTGAVDVALGPEASGLMCNDDQLSLALEKAGAISHERLWRLPLINEYRDSLKSDVADLKNTAGRSGSCIKAALFLEEFVGDTTWAHCDIASTAFIAEARGYLPKHATGLGVRLMLDFFQNKSAK